LLTVTTPICIACASDAFVTAFLRTLGVILWHEWIVIIVIPVVRPFHDVPRDVVEAISISLKCAHGIRARTTERCRTRSVGVTKGDLRREKTFFSFLVDAVIPPGVMGPIESTSSRLLPFRLRGKTLAKPFAIIRTFVPVDVRDGILFFTHRNLS